MNKEPNERRKKVIIIMCIALFIFATIYFVILSKAIADYRFFAGDILKFDGFLSSFLSLFT